MQKQIIEYRESLSPDIKKSKSHSRASSPFKTPANEENKFSGLTSAAASGQKRSEAEVQSVNQELRLRLDCIMEEKMQLEQEIRAYENKLRNKDEMKKKVDGLQAKLLISKQRNNELLDRLNGLVEKGDGSTVLDELATLIKRMPKESAQASSAGDRRGGSLQLSKMRT